MELIIEQSEIRSSAERGKQKVRTGYWKRWKGTCSRLELAQSPQVGNLLCSGQCRIASWPAVFP